MTQPTVLYSQIPVARLMESPLNNRVHFDKAKLAGLAANVKALGRIVAPLLARPIKDGQPWLDPDADLLTADSFEIAAGHRRYRAAKMADLEFAPVVIQCMTDDIFIETLTVENLQREDVHPMDEAKGYQMLLARPGYDAHVIAAKIGKEVPYVVRRLSLLRLIPAARKAFWANAINTAMALILARLTEEDQKEALGKLLVPELRNPTAWQKQHPLQADIRSSVALNTWVTNELMMDLKSAQFDILDAELVPKAGACPECPKRTGYQPSLFNEIKGKDLCTDRVCFAAKKAAATAAQLVEITAANDGVAPVLIATEYCHQNGGTKIHGSGSWTEVKKKTRCEFTKVGLVVQGRERVGKTIDVCTNPRCPVHAGRHGREPESVEEIEKRQKVERDNKIDASTRQIVLDQTAAAFDPKKATAEDMRILAVLAYQKFGNSESRKAMSKARTGKADGYLTRETFDEEAGHTKEKPETWLAKASASELLRLAFESALYESLSFYNYGGREDNLMLSAARWKVDPKAIRAQVASDLRTKEKAAELRRKARQQEKLAKEARAIARQEKAAGVVELPVPAAAKAKVKAKGKTVLALPAAPTAA
jgi:ParB family transcriptional regulator, chromosome partitioning protein